MEVNEILIALSPISEMLEADGYELGVESIAADRLALNISATGNACEECLIPKASFEAIVRKYLEEQGLHPQIETTYPAELP